MPYDPDMKRRWKSPDEVMDKYKYALEALANRSSIAMSEPNEPLWIT